MQTKVMVVEDERIIALDLKHELEGLGYKVSATVPSGELALKRMGELRPDVVLMDINLEGYIVGVEAARQIHTQHQVPVVFLTAYAEDETLKRAQASLPFGYLVKPCESRELHATLQMALARRSAEAALELSEERLRLALEAGRMDVVEWDSTTGKLISGGRAGTGFQSILAIGESAERFLARVHPDDRALVQTKVDNALQLGDTVDLVFRFLKPNGAQGWIEAHAKAHQSQGSKRLVGVVRDITERRQMEDQLRQAAAAYETSAVGIFIMDRKQRILSVNPAFTAITGYTEEEVLGVDADGLVHARPHPPEFFRRIEHAEGRQWQGETMCRHKYGEIFPAWESISAILDEAGHLTHYVVAFSSISAIRRAEEGLD